MATNVREQRRRRIMERGSDRLALITGQMKDLHESPSSPSPSTFRHIHSESSPPIISRFDLSTVDDVVEKGFEERKNMASIGFPENNNIAKIEPLLRKCVTSTDTTRAPDTDGLNKTVTSGDTVKLPRYLDQIRLFSSKKINASIIASERKRAICSLIVACLVVVSYIDHPLIFGFNLVSPESFIVSRPVYMILLTDVTIVLARLFRDTGNGREEAEEEKMAGKDEDNWTEAFKFLERGLVAYQAIRGIFIDFSIYIIVIVCGHSLV